MLSALVHSSYAPGIDKSQCNEGFPHKLVAGWMKEDTIDFLYYRFVAANIMTKSPVASGNVRERHDSGCV
jgi:hypothetical protein